MHTYSDQKVSSFRILITIKVAHIYKITFNLYTQIHSIKIKINTCINFHKLKLIKIISR